jgi:CheY-like chemotaxis protein
MVSEAPVDGGSGIKVLVADDQRVNQLILETFLRQEGHTVVVASDGVRAVELHRSERPDLVLMDIVMPTMDGLEAARLIRANSGETPTPLLFLTSVNDRQTMIEGFDLGDDFIPKPIDVSVLRAKLRAFIRLVQIQRQLREERQRVEGLIDGMKREGEMAAHVLDRVLAHTEPPDGRFLQYRVVPSAVFSGDMVLARRTPGGGLHLLLADAVGHGLPAAINILPLFFPFDGMSRKGCSLATLARELNRRVRSLLPADRFVAATLVSVDSNGSNIEIWNGGNPPALLIDAHGAVVERIDSMQMALGLNDDNPVLFEPRRLVCNGGEQLVVCSDGIWENPAFSGADPARAVASLLAATAPGERMEALIRAAVDAGQADDISAVVITAGKPGVGREAIESASPRSIGARLSLQFGPQALGQADTVESVIRVATSLGLVESFPALPAVLGELFANALDYGVLALDGRHKRRSAEDRQAFRDERQRRLDMLDEGFIAVEAEPTFVGGSRLLRLAVADSGAGFDWKRRSTFGADESDFDAQRGLARVGRLVVALDFNSEGSEAIAMIPAGAAELATEDQA